MLLRLKSLIMFILSTDAGTVKNSFYAATVQLLCINITGKCGMITENFYICEYKTRHLEST